MLALLGGPEVREQPASGYLEASLARLPADARARIRLHGKRPHDELPAFYRRADVLVVPSLSEAFGKPAVEAMASGLPVVATRVGGIPEVVADGETGLLVPPNDPVALAEAMGRLAADPALRARLGAAGRARAEERFSYDRIAREVETLDEESPAPSRPRSRGSRGRSASRPRPGRPTACRRAASPRAFEPTPPV